MGGLNSPSKAHPQLLIVSVANTRVSRSQRAAQLLPGLSPAAAQYTRTLGAPAARPHVVQPFTRAQAHCAASAPRRAVLDLDDTIIGRDWNRQRGWCDAPHAAARTPPRRNLPRGAHCRRRVFKRPGLEAFLRHMAQYYEIVVYTDQQPTFGAHAEHAPQLCSAPVAEQPCERGRERERGGRAQVSRCSTGSTQLAPSVSASTATRPATARRVMRHVSAPSRGSATVATAAAVNRREVVTRLALSARRACTYVT